MQNAAIERAKEHFGSLLERQIERVTAMKESADFVDYNALDTIKIGLLGGDGIGPAITDTARGVLERLLEDEVSRGKIEFRDIEGLTIENRAAHLQSIPDDVLAEIKECDVTLKGPTTTPEKGDGWPNLESANVGMRKELDLFANVRPVRVPSEGIDWVFFRENTEDLYALGSDGIDVTDDFTIDFRLISEPGSERIIRAAFEHAKQNGRDRVTVVTKANIVKLSDGRFPSSCRTRGRRIPRHRVGRLVHRHHDRQAPRHRTALRLSKSSSCPTCTATSSPTKPPRSRAELAPQGPPTSAPDTQCSKPFTAPHPAWSPKAAPNTPTHHPCSKPPQCSSSTSATPT